MVGSDRFPMLGLLGATALMLLAFAVVPARSMGATFNHTVITGGSEQDGCHGVLDNSVINYMGPGRGLEDDCNEKFSSPPSHSDVEVPMAVAGTAGHLQVLIQCNDASDLPSGTSFEFEVEKGGVDTLLGCTVIPPLSGDIAHNGSCHDDIHFASFSAGDKLSVKISPASIGGPDNDDCRVAGWSLIYSVPNNSNE